MYKVELTEKEARGVGESRWKDKNKRRWIFSLLLPLVIIVIIGFISAPNALNISNWVSMPIIVVFAGFFLFLFRLVSSLCTKAGKEFVSRLKENKDA